MKVKKKEELLIWLVDAMLDELDREQHQHNCINREAASVLNYAYLTMMQPRKFQVETFYLQCLKIDEQFLSGPNLIGQLLWQNCFVR